MLINFARTEIAGSMLFAAGIKIALAAARTTQIVFLESLTSSLKGSILDYLSKIGLKRPSCPHRNRS